MRKATENLIILEIEPTDIIAVGITNQKETSVLWSRKSGEVFNPLVWWDQRLRSGHEEILARTKNKRNYLRSVCGLPFDM